MTLFVQRQKHSILQAIGLEQQVQQQRSEDVLSSAIAVLKDRFSGEIRSQKAVYSVAEQLHDQAKDRLRKLSEQLDRELPPLTPMGRATFHANMKDAKNGSDQRHYFYKQIVETAKRYDYFANLQPYRSWVRMAITTEEIFEFVISFHGYGSGRNGVLAASAFSFQRVPEEEHENGEGREESKQPVAPRYNVVNVRPCIPEVFQFNYVEPPESIERRFKDWLEDACTIAISEWKRQIDN